MENRINTKIVITVSKNKKLLSCLRKLDSGEAASVNVEINYAYKKKPIKLSFLKIKTPTKTSDDFLVYAEYRSSKSSSKVVLGNASIKNIQESGFVSIGNKEAKECVIINTYSKNDSPDFRELKKVLLDTMELEDYIPSNCTPHKDISNSTILIELKPENPKIISYEVSMLPAVKTGKAQEHSTNPSVSQDNSSLRKDINSNTVKEKITTMASFVFSRDAYKYAKKLNKILSVGEIDIQADSFTKIGKISSFKSGIDIKSNNHIVVAISELDEQIATDCYNRHESSQFAAGALFGYQDYIRNMTIGAISKRLFEVKQNKIARKNLSRALKTTTEGIPPIRKRYMVMEEKSPLNKLPEGSSGLNYTQLMLKKRHESKTEPHTEKAKKEENNNKYITVAFECTLEDKDIVAKLFLQRNFRDYSIEFNTIAGNFNGEIKSVSMEKGKVIAWTEIKIEDAKKLNLGQNSEESQETHETIKALLRLGLIEKPKREVGKLYYKLPFPIYAGSVSMDNSFLKVESTVEHKEKSPISHLESLLEKNQKTSNQKRDKDLINIIAEALREIESIGKANVSKSSKAAATEDLFCKKTKVNSKKDNNATRPYQALNPLVTILTNDESKNKVKEIIEEANKTKSFPYKLDYNNNCVVKISDSLFSILECRNKLEDILKIRKDVDVGVFNLDHTGNLVLKKMFNVSSLTVYHSASKNIYALIGA